MSEPETPQNAIQPAPTDAADDAPRSGKGCLWALLGSFGCLLLALIALLLPVFLGFTSLNGLLGNLQSTLTGIVQPAPVAQTASTQTIVQSVMPLGQLVSVNVQLAKADIHVGVQQGALNACGYSANHVAVGAVEAGVDLTQISDANVIHDAVADRYTLTVPAPQITSCRIDFIRQYDRSTTACAVDWDEARILAQAVALQEFRDDALEGGILARAEREAAVALDSFVEALTGRPVEIVFAPSGEAATPPSCQPQPPQGWTFDPTTNSWSKPAS